LDQVRDQRQEVDDPGGGDRLVAQGLPGGVAYHVSFRCVVVAGRSDCSASTNDESTGARSPPPDRSSAATSTSVVPSVRRARTQTRRGRMNSDPSSPSMARTTPSRVTQTSGVRLICKRVQCLTPWNVTEPAPSGSCAVCPGWRSTRNCFPSGFFSWVMSALFIAYTDCGTPESSPRSPW